jgi:hypothetical protein
LKITAIQCMATGIRWAFWFASLRSEEFLREPGGPLRGHLSRDGVKSRELGRSRWRLDLVGFWGGLEILSGGSLVSDTGTGWRGCKISGVGGVHCAARVVTRTVSKTQ